MEIYHQLCRNRPTSSRVIEPAVMMKTMAVTVKSSEGFTAAHYT
jgi:hypothetical protein